MKPQRLYAPHLYDRYFRLRLPLTLWALAAWVALPWAMLLPKLQRFFGAWGEVLGDWPLLLGSLPVFFVLLITGHRMPDAGRFWRTAWRYGRWLLFLGLGLCILVLLWGQAEVLQSPADYLFAPAASILAIHAGFMVYLIRSRYLRDLFADFPEAADLERTRAKPLVSSTLVSPGEAHYQAGLQHLRAKQFDAALISFRNAVSTDPAHTNAWLAAGRLMQQMGYAEAAQQAFAAAQANESPIQAK